MDMTRVLRRFGVAVALGLVVLMVPLPEIGFVESSVAAVEPLPGVDPATPAEVAEVQAAADEPLGDQRVRALTEETPAFTLMAVVFDAAPTAPAMVRVKLPDGTWDAWTELHVDTGEGPDSPTDWGTEPFWVESADGYELDLAPADAEAAEVVLVRESLQRVVTVSEPVAGAATTAPFGINSRGAWGARSSRGIHYGSTIKKAVVHHTVSGNGYSQAQVPGIIRGIQAYHQDGRGWDDIGYNFVVDRFGGIWEGREGGIDRSVIGAHASGFNTNTVGISILGDYSGSRPSAAAIEGVSRVAGWKLFLGGTEPSGSGAVTSAGGPKYPAGTVVNLPNVVGHGDVGSTGCPGRTRELLGQIRQRAQDWANWTRAISGPTGVLEQLRSSGSTVTATGWAAEHGTGGATSVRLTTAGRSVVAATNKARPDVVAAHPSFNGTSGFSVSVKNVPPGLQDACVTALSSGKGKAKSLGCRTVRVADPAGVSPDGRIDTARAFTGRVQVGGWARDPDGSGRPVATLTVDGRSIFTKATANGRFWFDVRGIKEGTRRMCVVVRNTGAGRDVRVDCRYMVISGGSPTGTFDGFSQKGDKARVWGWALDPGAPGPSQIRITYDSWASTTIVADRGRADIARAFPGEGAAHGYTFEVTIPRGAHTLCATAINRGAGSDTLLGCRQVIVK